MARNIQLFGLPTEINDCVYTSERYPLILDPTGQSGQFLKYRSRYLHVLRKGDFEPENLRKGLVQCMHNGGWLVLDFDQVDVDLAGLFEPAAFPEAALSPIALFHEDTWGPLIRPSDEFSAKVTYEHSAALAEGAFQDRTKCHAPERVADVDSRFDPKESFRLIFTSRREGASEEQASRLCVLKVQVSEQQATSNAGVWAGGQEPKAQKSKEQMKLDEELLDCSLEGELEEVKARLAKGADSHVQDGRGCTPLAEAAVQGHLEVVRVLLDWKAPLGSDPNKAGYDKRTPLHRAAFQGHVATVQLLLERGADPRVKDKQGETPADLASSHAETMALLGSWDVAVTDRLLEERRAAKDVEDEKNVKNDEERKQLERRRKMEVLATLVEKGDGDELENELLTLEDAKVETFRDSRGNTALHLAAEFGKVEIATMLVTQFKVNVNVRDGKGWTPLAIAAFRGHKKMLGDIVGMKGDPDIANAYNKTAYDVAKDDEIKDTLKKLVDGPGSSTATSTAANSTAVNSTAADAAPKAKGKAKAKGRAKAGAGDAGSRASSGSARAKGKARAKAR